MEYNDVRLNAEIHGCKMRSQSSRKYLPDIIKEDLTEKDQAYIKRWLRK